MNERERVRDQEEEEEDIRRELPPRPLVIYFPFTSVFSSLCGVSSALF